MIPVDQAQITLDRGQSASELIANETFLDVVDDLSNYHLQAIVSALPGDAGRAARDHHHLLHYALREIAAELAQRVQTAEELKAILGLQDEDEDA